MPRNILILAPHHDDAEFGVGGYIHRLHREGEKHDITVAVFCHGDYTRGDGKTVSSEKRETETLLSFQMLGKINPIFLHLMVENHGPDLPLSVTAGVIEQLVKDTGAEEVFVCLPSFNQDHKAVWDAAHVAFRPGNLPQVHTLWAYEYPGNAWGPRPPEAGRAYVKVSAEDIFCKSVALAKHKSQFENRKVAVGPSAAITLAAQRGAEIGEENAELFYLLRSIA